MFNNKSKYFYILIYFFEVLISKRNESIFEILNLSFKMIEYLIFDPKKINLD